jgi:hypothetical protein
MAKQNEGERIDNAFPFRELEREWTRGLVTVEALRERLPGCWKRVDLPYRYLTAPITLFRAAGFVTDDPLGVAALPQKVKKVRVYRGQSAPEHLGISWTLSKEYAKHLAHGYAAPGKPCVMLGWIDRSKILAWLIERGEQEIVCDPNEIKRLSIMPVEYEGAVDPRCPVCRSCEQ